MTYLTFHSWVVFLDMLGIKIVAYTAAECQYMRQLCASQRCGRLESPRAPTVQRRGLLVGLSLISTLNITWPTSLYVPILPWLNVFEAIYYVQ